MKRTRPQAGFSLLELLTALSILAVLSSVALPRYAIYKEKAKAAACFAQRKDAENALTLYTQENPDKPLPSLGDLVSSGILSAEPACPSAGVYLWITPEGRDLPNLFCSIHGHPSLKIPSSAPGSTTTTTPPPSQAGGKPDAPPGLDRGGPPGHKPEVPPGKAK